MKSNVTVFPFDSLGGAGTAAGAQLLGDAVREILDDTDAETRPCRADCLRGRVAVREFDFDTTAKIAGWRDAGRRAATEALDAGEFLVWLGGNHLSVLPALEPLGRDALVVQFDAHLDIYSFHDTTAELSNGNFLRHFESPRPRLVNVGHRDLFLTAAETGEWFEAVYPAARLASDPDRALRELRAKVEAASRIWIDLDCDALDPTAMPAVQQPLPFGLAPHVFLQLFEAAWSKRVVGISISEFDPGRDDRDRGLTLLGWFLEYVLLRVHEK